MHSILIASFINRNENIIVIAHSIFSRHRFSLNFYAICRKIDVKFQTINLEFCVNAIFSPDTTHVLCNRIDIQHKRY